MNNHIFENLLEDVIAKARFKGAQIKSWSISPNGRTVIHFSGKLPIYYLSMRAAADTLIHQYKLISEYRDLYQYSGETFKRIPIIESSNEDQISLTEQAIYECDAIVQNMDNELTGSTKRKLHETLVKFNTSHQITPSEFYLFQNVLVEHYRNKVIDAPTTQKKRQLQMFSHFIEEISHSDL